MASRSQLLVDGAQHLVHVAARRQVRLQQQRGGVADVERVAHEAEVAADAGHRAVALHQPLDQPGRVAVGEHLGQHDVRQVAGEVADRVGHPPGRRPPPAAGASRSVYDSRRSAVRSGSAKSGRAGAGPGRHVAEVPLDQRGRLGHVEVAGDREHRVAAGVVAVEEVGGVGDGGRSRSTKEP